MVRHDGQVEQQELVLDWLGPVQSWLERRLLKPAGIEGPLAEGWEAGEVGNRSRCCSWSDLLRV